MLESHLSSTRVICADGASNELRLRGVRPDVIIGDFDSISAETLSYFQDQVEVVHKPSQYATDLEKALQHAVDAGAEEIIVTGVSGKRLDHSLTNWNILHKFAARTTLHVFDHHGWGTFLVTDREPRALRLSTARGKTVSLLAFGTANGISTKGLLYPLQDETLAWGVRDGQSNQASDDVVEIVLKQGVLFVFACEIWGRGLFEHHKLIRCEKRPLP